MLLLYSAQARRMGGPTRGGTVEPVSLDQNSRHEQVQLTTSRNEDRSAECDDQQQQQPQKLEKEREKKKNHSHEPRKK